MTKRLPIFYGKPFCHILWFRQIGVRKGSGLLSEENLSDFRV